MSRLHSTSRTTAACVRPQLAPALAALLCTLSGCGAMTTAPVANSPSTAAPRAALRSTAVQAAPSTRQMAPDGSDDPNDGGNNAGSGGASGGSGPNAPVVSPDVLTTFNARHTASGSVVSRSATVGALGLSMSSGRWRLDVPAGALPVGTRVTLTAANSRGPAVEVATVPANPGPFASPLMLSVDTRGAASNRTSDFVILVYDAASATWQPLGDSKANKKAKSVSASLTMPGIFGVGYADGTPAW